MRTLNAKSFWTYAGIAGVLGFLTYLLVAWIWLGAEDLYPDPEYRSYAAAKSDYERWRRDNDDRSWQRTFEEILAGKKPLEAAPAGAPREFVGSIRALMKGAESDPEAWSRALTGLFLSPEGKPRANNWVACTYIEGRNNAQILDSCRFTGWAAVLNDPVRVAKVMRGDDAALTKVSEAPKVPEYAGAKLLTQPAWYRPLKWIVFSLLFGIYFCIIGLLTRLIVADGGYGERKDPDAKGWGHPFRGWPNFVLGWLIMLATLPGFLFTRGLYLLVIDVTPAINSRIKPAWRGFISLFIAKPSFADEYEEFAVQLNAMREAAAGNPEIVKQIEDLGSQVQKAQDAKKLAKLKDSLSHIKSYMELTSEIGA